MGFISCGKCEKIYIYFFIFYSLTMIILSIILSFVYENITNFENYSNILMILLINNLGQIFCFIPELIIKKEDKHAKKNSLGGKKEKASLQLNIYLMIYQIK